MVELTRLNGTVFSLNSDLIETVEATPDTVILLVNGHRYIVKESPREVRQRILAFRRDFQVSFDGRPAEDVR